MIGVGGATYRWDSPPLPAGRRLLEPTPSLDRFTPSTPAPVYARPRFPESTRKTASVPRLAAWAWAAAGALLKGAGVYAPAVEK
jgi:hypothetical protein